MNAESSPYCLIMAGGVGRRFWPLSRIENPKQFLSFFGDRSLLQMTVDRMTALVPPERCLIVTNERYYAETARQLPELPPENILLEPMGRNTAPCIAYGATVVRRRVADGVMIVLPADHLISDVPAFHEVLNVAVGEARKPGVLCTIGITPTTPATGYGYIEYDQEAIHSGVHTVISFTEKPNRETAREFLAAGRYLWNSGMFVWRADTILNEMQRSIPQVYSCFEPLLNQPADQSDIVKDAFTRSPSISVDYGVMEKAQQVLVTPGDFGWSDVGDWQAAYDVSPKDEDGNALTGPVSALDVKNCFAHAKEREIVLLGVENLVVVDSGDTVLVCDRSQTQRVKEAANLVDQTDPARKQ